MKNETKSATKQAKEKGSPINGVVPPKDRRFGQPNGNPRHNGAWKKEDTPRYKMERMITLKKEELQTIIDDPNAPEFEKSIADIIMSIRVDVNDEGNPLPAHQRIKTIESLINQVYGTPAQTQVTVNADMEEKEKAGFIKGIFIPGSDNDDRGTDSSR